MRSLKIDISSNIEDFNLRFSKDDNKYNVLMWRLSYFFDLAETYSQFINNQELFQKNSTLYNAILNEMILNICIIFDVNGESSLYHYWVKEFSLCLKDEHLKPLFVNLKQILMNLKQILMNYYSFESDINIKIVNKKDPNDKKYINKTLLDCFILRNKYIGHNLKPQDYETVNNIHNRNIDLLSIYNDLKSIYCELIKLYTLETQEKKIMKNNIVVPNRVRI